MIDEQVPCITITSIGRVWCSSGRCTVTNSVGCDLQEDIFSDRSYYYYNRLPLIIVEKWLLSANTSSCFWYYRILVSDFWWSFKVENPISSQEFFPWYLNNCILHRVRIRIIVVWRRWTGRPRNLRTQSSGRITPCYVKRVIHAYYITHAAAINYLMRIRA